MKTTRTAVVGVGVQGKRHAQKLAALAASELVAVVDINEDRAIAIAAEFGAEPLTDYRDLIGKVDAVVLATPTSVHFEIANPLLRNGIHLLIEKPIATTVHEAMELVRLADENSLIMQVGHLERFNPAIIALAKRINGPQFIESHRIAPYKPRALDVSVVLDLMIHDIDLIRSFVQSPMQRVDAVGRSVFSDSIDVANARIQFASGCIANVTSSRVSMKTERTLRVFQADEYVSADLHNKTATRYAKKGPGPVTGPEDVMIDKMCFGGGDAMMDQAAAFLDAVAGGSPPLVSGRTATEALETAIAIGEAITRQKSENESTFPGPGASLREACL